MDTPRTDGTYSLDELDDYKVAEGEPDPRGWDVYSTDNQKLGEVKDLLVDLQTMTVRYLDVELDEELAGEDGRHVLLPVGTARLDEEGKDRVLVQTAPERVRAIPAYQRDGAVKRDYEDSLFTSMGLGAGVGLTQADYYGRPEFDTDRFYSSRRGRVDRDRTDTAAGALGNAEREVKDNTRSFGDRVADKVDDVKDSVDGNPASKWGRDATDRPAR